MPPGQTIWSGWQYQDLTGNREVKSEEFTDAAVSTAKRRNGETGKRGNGETPGWAQHARSRRRQRPERNSKCAATRPTFRLAPTPMNNPSHGASVLQSICSRRSEPKVPTRTRHERTFGLMPMPAVSRAMGYWASPTGGRKHCTHLVLQLWNLLPFFRRHVSESSFPLIASLPGLLCLTAP